MRVDRSRHRYDHEAAFMSWWNEGKRRRLTDVAREYGVRYETLLATVKKERWYERAEALDAEVEEQTRKVIGKTIADRRLENLKLIDTLKARFARYLTTNAVAAPTTRELIELFRIEELLTGGATERVGGETPRSSAALSLAALEEELAALDDGQVDADVEAMHKAQERSAIEGPEPDESA
jgi:hypothetical protein